MLAKWNWMIFLYFKNLFRLFYLNFLFVLHPYLHSQWSIFVELFYSSINCLKITVFLFSILTIYPLISIKLIVFINLWFCIYLITWQVVHHREFLAIHIFFASFQLFDGLCKIQFGMIILNKAIILELME